MIDPFNNTAPGAIPLSSIPAATPAKIAITEQVSPNSLADEAEFQGVALSASAGDVVLLTGQTDPAENGFYVVGAEGGDRDVSAGRFTDHIGPSGEDGHYLQFKVAITAGDNAGKEYFLASGIPALFEDGLEFRELTDDTPIVPSGAFENAAPDGSKTNSHTTAFSNSAPGQHS